jgi:rhodanese-related sulfurtransferase
LRAFKSAAVVLLVAAAPSGAQEMRVFPDQPQVELTINGKTVIIARTQDADAVLSDAARVAPACPPNCIQPMSAAPGVMAFGAAEVIGFLQGEATVGSGLLIDLRLPDAFGQGHVPGAVNVPHVTLSPDNPAQGDILKALGVSVTPDGGPDFAAAPALTLYGEGPFSPVAVEAIGYLLAAGYPAERLYYYRGGVQEWRQFGLTLAEPGDQG